MESNEKELKEIERNAKGNERKYMEMKGNERKWKEKEEMKGNGRLLSYLPRSCALAPDQRVCDDSATSQRHRIGREQ